MLRPRSAEDGLLDLAGDDYLGLTRDPRVIAGGVDALRLWVAGATGSRLVTSSTAVHAAWETELASFTGFAAALAFPSGFLANLGVVTALSGPGVLIVSDAVPAPPSAVVSVVLGEPQRAVAAAVLYAERGVRVGCFRPPSVPVGTSRLRLTARATLTPAELSLAASVLGGVLVEHRQRSCSVNVAGPTAMAEQTGAANSAAGRAL